MTEDRKLNLGCGDRPREGYLNYDAVPRSDDVISWNAGEGLRDHEGVPLGDETVAFIVCEHMIEHIPISDNEYIWFKFWEECWRVMKVGAHMELSTPHGDSLWAWADPGHRRAIYLETFSFLDAKGYMAARGDDLNSRSPYEPRCDFEMLMGKLLKAKPRMDRIVDEIGNLHVLLGKRPLPEGYLR